MKAFEILTFRIFETEVVVLVKVTSDGLVRCAFGGAPIPRDADGQPVSISADLKVAADRAFSLVAGSRRQAGETNGKHSNAQAPVHDNDDVAPDPADRVTARQLSALYGASRRHNLGREGLTRMVADHTGKRGAQFLTKREASALLDALNGRSDQ